MFTHSSRVRSSYTTILGPESSTERSWYPCWCSCSQLFATLYYSLWIFGVLTSMFFSHIRKLMTFKSAQIFGSNSRIKSSRRLKPWWYPGWVCLSRLLQEIYRLFTASKSWRSVCSGATRGKYSRASLTLSRRPLSFTRLLRESKKRKRRAEPTWFGETTRWTSQFQTS